LLDDVDDNVLL